MNPIANNLGKFVTYMTKNDAMAPIIGLEATVTGGRTIQAYKRGGEDEARERLIEETTGAVVWLWGVKSLNAVGDKILKKMFGANFDVGTDKVLRTPFENFIKKNPPKNFSSKQVALIKAAKVLASVVLADAFIGLVVPPLNQALTRNLAKKRSEDKAHAKVPNEKDKITIQNKDSISDKPSFKGGGALSAINTFTNAIENTNTGKLLSTDAGLISGRMYSARNNEERKEIAIRDIGSIYFYMWAQNHIGNVLNFAETGRFTRLNPTSAGILDEHLAKFLKSKGNELTTEEFKKLVLGETPKAVNDLEKIKFETAELGAIDKFFNNFKNNKKEPLKAITVKDLKEQTSKIKELSEVFSDKNIISRIEKMSQLQPLRKGEAVITKQQIIDALNIAEINNPELLDKMFTQFTDGASKDELKFVSNDKLYNLKKEMEDYINDICKKAKNGKINHDVLNNMKNKNLMFSGINFLAGFGIAALFLSTLIPKFQYWYTQHTTGKNEFPGTYDLDEDIKTNKSHN